MKIQICKYKICKYKNHYVRKMNSDLDEIVVQNGVHYIIKPISLVSFPSVRKVFINFAYLVPDHGYSELIFNYLDENDQLIFDRNLIHEWRINYRVWEDWGSNFIQPLLDYIVYLNAPDSDDDNE